MRIKGFLIILLILLSLLPAYQLNRWLQKVINPRASFLRFLLYMFTGFALAFGYTFVLTFLILKLIPLH